MTGEASIKASPVTEQTPTAGQAGSPNGGFRWTSRRFIRDLAFANLPGPFQRLRAYLWLLVFSYSMGMAGVGAWSLFETILAMATAVATLLQGNAMMRFLSGERTREET